MKLFFDAKIIKTYTCKSRAVSFLKFINGSFLLINEH